MRMVKRRIKLFWEANSFPFEIPYNYLKFSTKAEKIFDFIFPMILSLAIMVLFWIVDPDTSTVLKGIKEINKQSLTFISILAGFNIASLSVLATAGSSLLNKLREQHSTRIEGKTLFEVMMTFFSAAIITQFFIILIGLVILIISSIINFPKDITLDNWLFVLLALWIYTLILTLFVSIRNLKDTVLYNDKRRLLVKKHGPLSRAS